jgi:hypothetical protein
MRENQCFGELPKPKELKLCAARRKVKMVYTPLRLSGSGANHGDGSLYEGDPFSNKPPNPVQREATSSARCAASRRWLKSAETAVGIELVFDLAGRVSLAAVPAFELRVLSAKRRM